MVDRIRVTLGVRVPLSLALLMGVASTSASTGQAIRVVPAATFGEPPKLQAGTYQTRPGFRPEATFRVGPGWYGSGDRSEWAVGKGLNRDEQRFQAAGVYVTRLSIRYATAVKRFQALTTLVAGAPSPTRIGGYRAVTFRATVKGDHAVLPGIAPGLDIPANSGGQQTFVDVRGTTLLVRTEVFQKTTGGAAVRSLLASIRFPR